MTHHLNSCNGDLFSTEQDELPPVTFKSKYRSYLSKKYIRKCRLKKQQSFISTNAETYLTRVLIVSWSTNLLFSSVVVTFIIQSQTVAWRSDKQWHQHEGGTDHWFCPHEWLGPFILYIQHRCFWWLGDARGHDIRSRAISRAPYWNENVVILGKLSSLAAPKVVKMTSAKSVDICWTIHNWNWISEASAVENYPLFINIFNINNINDACVQICIM